MPSLAEQLSNAGSSLVTSPVRVTAVGVGLCPAWKMETGAFPNSHPFLPLWFSEFPQPAGGTLL